MAKADLSKLSIDEESRNNSGPRWGIIAAVILGTAVILAVIIVFLMRGGAPEVSVAAAGGVNSGSGPVVLNASGYVTPRVRATVASKITGRVTEMLVEEGMVVEEGQVLARLDDREVLAYLDSARADHRVAQTTVKELEVSLANARRTLRRLRDIEGDGIVSTEDLDQAQAAADVLVARLATARNSVTAAGARVQMARRDLENCTVRAPFSGIAVSKNAQAGEMVSPISAGGGFTRTGISTIVDMNSLEIEVDVNESYIARVTPGQKVEANLDAYPDWRIPCSVRTVIPTADRQKATVKVRISFEELDPRILPDMGVKVAFIEEEAESGGPSPRALVPKGAVRSDGGREVVYVYRDGVVERRAVTTGRERMGEMEILAGLSAGEEVVVSSTAELSDGMRVKLAETK